MSPAQAIEAMMAARDDVGPLVENGWLFLSRIVPDRGCVPLDCEVYSHPRHCITFSIRKYYCIKIIDVFGAIGNFGKLAQNLSLLLTYVIRPPGHRRYGIQILTICLVDKIIVLLEYRLRGLNLLWRGHATIQKTRISL